MAAARPIYMDHQATTPCDPRVLEAMLPYFTERFGNPASRTHLYGWQAEDAVDRARGQVAELIGARSPREVVFTSGATESDNLAIKGALAAYGRRGRHLVTSAVEHPAVLDSVRWLEGRGEAEVSVVEVDAEGRVDPESVAAAIREDTILVSVMHANNEIGTVNDLEAIGRVCREHGVLFHTDAAQSAGKIPVDVERMNVDLLSLSAHKLYGPKGVGALYVRRRGPRVRLEALLHGGGHEHGMRSGTLPVPLLVGFGEAAALALAEQEEERERLAALRDRLLAILAEGVPGLRVNGSLDHRLPGNLNVAFEGLDGEALLIALRGDVALSSGSACSSATQRPSHVLEAIGLEHRLAHASIRFGLGRTTTAEEVERAGRLVVEKARALR